MGSWASCFIYDTAGTRAKINVSQLLSTVPGTQYVFNSNYTVCSYYSLLLNRPCQAFQVQLLLVPQVFPSPRTPVTLRCSLPFLLLSLVTEGNHHVSVSPWCRLVCTVALGPTRVPQGLNWPSVWPHVCLPSVPLRNRFSCFLQ